MSTETDFSPLQAGDRKNTATGLGRQKSLTEHFVETIAGKIQAGDLQAGDKLPTEASMMREYGVSRTVVREALSRLQANGIVETRHGVGTFILDLPEQRSPFPSHSPVTLRDVICMMELRVSLETEAAALAAMRASDENFMAMRVLLDEFSRQVERREAAIETDRSFHMEIARATGNKYFEDFFQYLGNVIPRGRVNNAHVDTESLQEYLTRTNREHRVILRAIENRDPESARAAMRVHLDGSKDRLSRALSRLTEVSGAGPGV